MEDGGAINDGKSISATRPGILVHRDGRLQILARSENRAIMRYGPSIKVIAGPR
jgi:hypothetical protein